MRRKDTVNIRETVMYGDVNAYITEKGRCEPALYNNV
jgi:hypothetical protein